MKNEAQYVYEKLERHLCDGFDAGLTLRAVAPNADEMA